MGTSSRPPGALTVRSRVTHPKDSSREYIQYLHKGLALTDGVHIEDQLERLGRFRSHIEGDWETGCWKSTGPTNQDGYGTMQAKGMWLAHRYAYVWFMGGHDPKRELDHVCNVITCVRPDHLEPVTGTRNNQLRHARALAGALDYWRDSHRLPASLAMASWAVSEDLPCYTPNPRIGESGYGDSISGVLVLEPKVQISDGVWIAEPVELRRAA